MKEIAPIWESKEPVKLEAMQNSLNFVLFQLGLLDSVALDENRQDRTESLLDLLGLDTPSVPPNEED